MLWNCGRTRDFCIGTSRSSPSLSQSLYFNRYNVHKNLFTSISIIPKRCCGPLCFQVEWTPSAFSICAIETFLYLINGEDIEKQRPRIKWNAWRLSGTAIRNEMADKFHLSDETITISQLEIIISESEIIRIARKWNIKKRTQHQHCNIWRAIKHPPLSSSNDTRGREREWSIKRTSSNSRSPVWAYNKRANCQVQIQAYFYRTEFD